MCLPSIPVRFKTDRLSATGYELSVLYERCNPSASWLTILIEGSAIACEERPYLLAALRIQKCWADMMLNCKALRAMGVQNVA